MLQRGPCWVSKYRTGMERMGEDKPITLEPTCRSHGSLHELDVPLPICNQSGDLPSAESFKANLDLAKMLYK